MVYYVQTYFENMSGNLRIGAEICNKDRTAPVTIVWWGYTDTFYLFLFRILHYRKDDRVQTFRGTVFALIGSRRFIQGMLVHKK
jgi:hypothetical protein